MFAKLRLRYKISIGFAFMIILITISVGLFLGYLSFMEDEFRAIISYHNLHETISRVKTALDDLNGILWKTTAVVSTDAGVITENKINNFQQALAKLSQQVTSVEEKLNLEDLRQKTEAIKMITRKVNSYLETGKRDLALELLLSAETESRFRSMNEPLATLELRVNNALNERFKAFDRMHKRVRLEIIISFLILIGTSIVLSILISSSISKRVKELINNISVSLTQISSSLEEQERFASEQASSVNETTATMGEFESSFRNTAENSRESREKLEQTLSSINQSMEMMESTASSIASLQEKIQKIADKILELSEKNNEIEQITGMVTQIAEETNMLALNAAVEATRAGEYGKGFAVVAQEIRKLSNESKKSAEKIRNMVTEIQKATTSTVMVTEEGTHTVQEVFDAMENTTRSFVEQIKSIEFALDIAKQAYFEIEQQKTAVQQVYSAMEDITNSVQANAEGITRIQKTIQELADSSRNIQRQI